MNKAFTTGAAALSALLPLLLVVSLVPRITGSVPANLVPNDVQERINIVFPQGWSFFTKSVREDTPYAHVLEDGMLIDPYPDAVSARSVMGISRWHRTGNLDMALISHEIDEAAIEPVECTVARIVECAEGFAPEDVIDISLEADHRWCGDVVVESRSPHPYSYRSFDEGNAKTRVWRVRVTC